MSIITTVYDKNNTISTGYYHTYKGDKVPFEAIGTEQECLSMVEQLQQSEDDNEVTHVITYDKVKCATPVSTGFALHNVWLPPAIDWDSVVHNLG
jgi:hypothetical protein